MDRPRQLRGSCVSEKLFLAERSVHLRAWRKPFSRAWSRRKQWLCRAAMGSLLLCPLPNSSPAQFPAPVAGEFGESESTIHLPETEPFLALMRPPHPISGLTKAAIDEAQVLATDEQGNASTSLSSLATDSHCVAYVPNESGLYSVRIQRDGGMSQVGDIAVLNDALCVMPPIWNDDPMWEVPETLVWLQAKRKYYFVHRSHQATLLPIQLIVNRMHDQQLQLVHRSIELDKEGNGKRCVRLPDSSSREQFIVESPITGMLEIQLQGIGPDEDPMLRVFDEAYNLIDVNDDSPDGSSDSLIRLFVDAGQRFIVEASLYQGYGGPTWLKFQGLPELTLDKAAKSIEVDRDRHVQLHGELPDPHSQDFYRFVAKSDGPLTIQMSSAEEGNIDSLLSVFDRERRLVGLEDDVLNSHDASLTFFATAGQEYYVRATPYSGTHGPYRLDFWSGGAPTPFDQAISVRTHPSGYATLRNQITSAEPFKLFRLESPTYSQFRVSMVSGMSSDWNTRLILFDQDLQPFSEAELDESDGSATLRFESKPNETMYLLATSSDEEEGAFSLVVRRSDHVSPFEHPQRVELSPQHRLFIRDAFHLLREEKTYQFVSTCAGPLMAQCEGQGENRPDVRLAVYDEAERMIACNQGLVVGSFQESFDAALSFEAQVGATYTLLVGMDEARPGPFELSVGPGRLEGPFAHARQLFFKDQAAVTVEGHADGSRRGHYFRFEAPVTGKISLIQRSVVSGEVDSLLSVYDRDGRELALNDDTFATDAAITLHVKEGETYFIRAGSYEGTHGDYRLSVAVGDLPGPFDDAIAIDLAKWPRWLRAGSLELDHPIQHYQIEAPRYGKLVVTLRAGAASEFDALLILYNEAGVEVDASDDAFAGSLDAQLMHVAKPGEIFFVAVTSADDRPGAYEVGIEFEEMKDPFDIAIPVTLNDGEFRLNGEFKDAASISVLRWEPTEDGRYRVRLGSSGEESTVDTQLSVFDQDRELIAMNDDASETQTDSELILEVRRGQTLFLQAGQYSGTAGNFSLLIVPAPLNDSSD